MSKQLFYNHLDQPIGYPLGDWQNPPSMPESTLSGQYCKLQKLSIEQHGKALFEAFSQDKKHHNWTYLPYGPFASYAAFRDWLEGFGQGSGIYFYSIIEPSKQQAVGLASYLRIQPDQGSTEIGHIHFSPLMQRNVIATESIYLLAKHAFEQGYRRLEWKCDNLNQRSKNAALRFGFQFEGVFRQATHYKGRNRDTAWFAIIDKEWPEIQQGYQQWLATDNFHSDGTQKRKLSECY